MDTTVYDLQSVDEAERAEQLRQIRTLRRSVVLWVTALGLALLVVTLLVVSSNVQAGTSAMEAELNTLQNELITLQGTNPEVQTILDEVTAMREQVTALEAAALPPNIDWSAIVLAIDSYDRRRIALENVNQAELRMTLSGAAVDNNAVIEYAQLLAATPQVASVEIQSIRSVPPPTATPTPEPAEGEENPPTPVDAGSDEPMMAIEFVMVLVLDPSVQ